MKCHSVLDTESIDSRFRGNDSFTVIFNFEFLIGANYE